LEPLSILNAGGGHIPAMVAPEYDFDVQAADDRFDRVVAVAWVISEIALDVFSLFFWAALLLFAAAAVTGG
jgi:hypothetical protein